MGIEYVLVDEVRREIFELGKGGWSSVFEGCLKGGILMALPTPEEMTDRFIEATYCDVKGNWIEDMQNIHEWVGWRNTPVILMTQEVFEDTHSLPKSQIGKDDYWKRGFRCTGSRYDDTVLDNPLEESAWNVCDLATGIDVPDDVYAGVGLKKLGRTLSLDPEWLFNIIDTEVKGVQSTLGISHEYRRGISDLVFALKIKLRDEFGLPRA